MMKKRKSPIPHGDHNNDDEDSEMEIVDEEKVEAVEDVEGNDDDDDDDDDSDDEDDAGEALEDRNPGAAVAVEEENPFMDAFYGLSSSNPSERAQAANILLYHCLLGPDANIKDAAYALRRLLNGLCSGRAASRQGNASALASFLKVSFEGGQLEEIIRQSGNENEESKSEGSILEYVRQRLLKATDPSAIQGRKKGSEERDYQFGRLFGILSIARSGILLPGTSEEKTKACDVHEILSVSRELVSDLVELYWHKKWMREPAAHAIGTILNTLYTADNGNDAKKIVLQLVEELVVPKILLNESGAFSIDEYGPEQIALAATIQSHISDHPDGLPSPLDKAILSTETIPAIASTLAKTSSVTQPRMHLVWDSIWVFLTESDTDSTEKSVSRAETRTIRKVSLLGGNSSRDIIESLIRRVVVDGLLKLDASEGSGKATHEQRALALCIVRNLLGVPFNSSITGPTIIQLDASDFESILTPAIIRRLFLDVICAGGGVSKKAHHLKPLALQIVQSMVESMTQDVSESGMNRRLSIAQCFVRVEPRFDALTKTTTISELIGLSEQPIDEFGAVQSAAMAKYFHFLEQQVISLVEGGSKVTEVHHLIDLLYQSAKRLLRVELVEGKETKELVEFKSEMVQRILGFFMACAFFDCSNMSGEKTSSKKSKKRKSKGATSEHPVVEAGMRVKGLKNLPYDARFVLSQRFYSLLAEYINASLHSQAGGSVAKDSAMLEIVADVCKGWKMIETAGAKPLFPAIDGGEDDEDESESPERIVSNLQALAKDLVSATDNSDDPKMKARKRCATGCAALVSTLFLHLLGCGKPEDIMGEEDVTTEDDDDSSDIVEAIEGIGELTPIILNDSADKEQNPLAGIAEVCIGLFSSRICSTNPGRGASPRLIREAIKFAWMGVLSASSVAETDRFDSDVASVLLSGIGAEGNDMDGNANLGDQGDKAHSDEDVDDEGSSSDIEDFSKVGKMMLDDDDDDDDDDEKDMSSEHQAAEDQDKDVEITSDKLNSLLEEDSDAEIDEGELEHHEGADAALAMLIKMKQDARKASQKARERVEIEKQIRCTLLFETLLGTSESWAGVLRSDILLQMIPPLLTYRNRLEKSLSRITGKVSGAESSTKRAMMDRLTSILKTKLFKQKFAAMPTSGKVDIVECCNMLASSILDMARRNVSNDQRAVCSGGLVTVVKALHGSEDAFKVALVYCSAVEEWSTKGTTRLETSLFDDFIHHCPSVAQATLMSPLASAAKSARDPYLRCQSFHLLCKLLNSKLNQQSSDFETLAMNKTKESIPEVFASICIELKDPEMQKSKRIKEVLKAAEKLCLFVKSCSITLPVDKLSVLVGEAESKHDNPGVKHIIDNVMAAIESLKQGSQETPEDEEDKEMDDQDNPAEGNGPSSKKDKTKKKKKKKRGKK